MKGDNMDEKIIIEKEIPIIQYDRHFIPSNFSMLTREQLRDIARRFNIPRGQNKSNTIYNLYRYQAELDPERIKVTVKIEID
jgi:hypothetical protein